jgi:transcriptional regulator with XRE-family HTH domain
MARAALYWSVEQLAEAAGVHRNTISNFETGKYAGDPETRAAIKRALEAAGVVFTEENGEAEVKLRRHREGDLVRFRPETRMRFDYGIAADEVGTVVQVEPHPPQTGPTYKISVQFPSYPRALPFVFWPEYMLMKSAPDKAEPQRQDEMMISDPKIIIDNFCTICERVWMDYNLYLSLFETDERTLNLYTSVAPFCFRDLNDIFIYYLIIQFSKVTDPANTGKKSNLTTNYILEKLIWPDAIHQQLREVNDRLMSFRQCIEPARNRRVVHVDLSAQIEQLDNLGNFLKDADKQFLQDLQIFVNIAYGHLYNGAPRPIDVAMSTDTHQLVRALEKSVIFDRCSKCGVGERAAAILDYEKGSE